MSDFNDKIKTLKVLRTLNIFIAIIGTTGNIFTFYVCLRKKLRKISTFKLFAFHALSDTLGLYEWNLQQFFIAYFVDYERILLWYCKLNDYLQNVSFEISAWLMVSITVDRLLAIKLKFWSSVYFKSQRVTFLAVAVYLFFILINIPYLIFNGYSEINTNGTEEVFCDSSKRAPFIIDFYSIFLLTMYSIVPFTIILIFNLQLIYIILVNKKKITDIIGNKKNEIKNGKYKKQTITTIIITSLFVLFSLPTSSIQGSNYNLYKSTLDGELMVSIFNLLTFFFQASNFIMLYLTNRQFFREVKSIYKQHLPNIDLTKTKSDKAS